jgi:hypothetical protein
LCLFVMRVRGGTSEADKYFSRSFRVLNFKL